MALDEKDRLRSREQAQEASMAYLALARDPFGNPAGSLAAAQVCAILALSLPPAAEVE